MLWLFALTYKGLWTTLNAAKANGALRNHGFPPWFLNWYGKFLHKRYVNVEYKGNRGRAALFRQKVMHLSDIR